MKTSKILPALLFAVLTFQVAFSQVTGKGNISISGPRFTYPLIEKWISEYNSLHPEVQISIAPKAADPRLADLKIIAHAPGDNDLDKDQKLFLVNKYALLPVTG